jgi:PhnB protein
MLAATQTVARPKEIDAMRLDAIVPEIFVHDGRGAIDFYTRAFGAVERSRTLSPDKTKVMHCQLEIDGQRLVVCDEFTAAAGGTCRCPRTLGGTGVRFVLEVDDADRVVTQAVKAGATIMFPVTDMFWGGRYGKLLDPYGHEWGINQQKATLTAAEQAKSAEEYFSAKKTS